jgi:hypothetical protein
MHGLLEVDITEARRLLAQYNPPLSLTAFVIASTARAAAAHPQVHAYRDWRGRLVQHRHVDVQTLIEVPTAQGPFGLVHVVRDADVRSVGDISAELRAVKADPATTMTGHLLRTVAPAAGRIPGLYRAMYAAMSRSVRVHCHRTASHRGRDVRRRRRARHRPTTGIPIIVVGGAASARRQRSHELRDARHRDHRPTSSTALPPPATAPNCAPHGDRRRPDPTVHQAPAGHDET